MGVSYSPLTDWTIAMAFSDPQTVTINAVAQTLPRTGTTGTSSSYRKDDGLVALNVSHSYGKRIRSSVRLDHSKIAADPLISAQSIRYSMSVYAVIDRPITGYTVAEAKQVADALFAYLTATSGSNVTKVLGLEH